MSYKIFFTCFLLLSCLVATVSAEDDILIVTEEWPPYNYLEGDDITGFSAEIVQNILETLDLQYEIQLLPSMRASHVLNNRPHTMMFSLFRTAEREATYKWIGPLGDGSIYFYTRKDTNLRIDTLEDMKDPDLRVCSRHAGLIYDLLVEQGFTNLDASATSSLQIYRKLLGGRCDLAISDADLGVRYHLKSLDLTLENVFEKIPIPIFEAELYLAASHDISDEEIQRWQTALDTLKRNGTYESILQKYHWQ